MRRFTKRLLLCGMLAATLLTLTVSAERQTFDLTQIPEHGSSTTARYNPKDDNEGKAYVHTTSATVVSGTTLMQAWVVDASGSMVAEKATLPYKGLANPVYHGGKNITGSLYKLRISYSAITSRAPDRGEAHGYWYS